MSDYDEKVDYPDPGLSVTTPGTWIPDRDGWREDGSIGEDDEFYPADEVLPVLRLLFDIVTQGMANFGDIDMVSIPIPLMERARKMATEVLDLTVECRTCFDSKKSIAWHPDRGEVDLGGCEDCNPDEEDDAIDTRRPDYV